MHASDTNSSTDGAGSPPPAAPAEIASVVNNGRAAVTTMRQCAALDLFTAGTAELSACGAYR